LGIAKVSTVLILRWIGPRLIQPKPWKEAPPQLCGHSNSFQDQDAIDFTDNDLSSLGNFPFFPRLRTLLLARNRITHIQPTLATSIPGLKNLVLTANNLSELADLDPLRNLDRLTHLSLLENPVTRKEVRDTPRRAPTTNILN
jgi:hypothetical protein